MLGESATSCVHRRDISNFKKVPGRQEWITAIECISASGIAVPPLVIFAAKYTNTGWIPTTALLNWRFSTSTSGWTSDSHAYEWITTVFDPETRRADKERRLLILDGHGSHLTARFIAYCQSRAIDIVILPPHTSHILQPLDVGIFAPLKRALSSRVDALFRLDAGRVPRVEWTTGYIEAREQAFTTSNILSSFRATGVSQLSPITILSTLRMPTPPHTTPQPIESTAALDLSLLNSSPPDGTELRQANAVVSTALRGSTLESPVRRFIERTGAALEKTQSENVLLRKENNEQRELLQQRKERKRGKRVALKGKFVFNTQEILEVVEKAEAEASRSKSKGKRPRRRNASKPNDTIEEIRESIESESESDCVIVAMRR